jgi:hypothetical protein
LVGALAVWTRTRQITDRQLGCVAQESSCSSPAPARSGSGHGQSGRPAAFASGNRRFEAVEIDVATKTARRGCASRRCAWRWPSQHRSGFDEIAFLRQDLLIGNSSARSSAARPQEARHAVQGREVNSAEPSNVENSASRSCGAYNARDAQQGGDRRREPARRWACCASWSRSWREWRRVAEGSASDTARRCAACEQAGRSRRHANEKLDARHA